MHLSISIGLTALEAEDDDAADDAEDEAALREMGEFMKMQAKVYF